MEEGTFLHHDHSTEVLFESHVGNLTMSVCLLNSEQGQQPGETLLITPIAAALLVPRKVLCVLLL